MPRKFWSFLQLASNHDWGCWTGFFEEMNATAFGARIKFKWIQVEWLIRKLEIILGRAVQWEEYFYLSSGNILISSWKNDKILILDCHGACTNWCGNAERLLKRHQSIHQFGGIPGKMIACSHQSHLRFQSHIIFRRMDLKKNAAICI